MPQPGGVAKQQPTQTNEAELISCYEGHVRRLSNRVRLQKLVRGGQDEEEEIFSFFFKLKFKKGKLTRDDAGYGSENCSASLVLWTAL